MPILIVCKIIKNKGLRISTMGGRVNCSRYDPIRVVRRHDFERLSRIFLILLKSNNYDKFIPESDFIGRQYKY